MQVMGVSWHFRMMRRVMPSFAQLAGRVLPMEAVFGDLQAAGDNVKTLEHLEQAAIAQGEPQTKQAAVALGLFTHDDAT